MTEILDRYIDEVQSLSGRTALDRVGHAATLARTLSEAADQLVDHFVQAARAAGQSWSEIGDALGVSKQAAQQRFVPPSGDFLRFTDRAREIVVVAGEQASGLHHGYLGTEHFLLAMLVDDGSLAGKALTAAGISYDEVRASVLEKVGLGSTPGGTEEPSFTPRARGMLKRGFREAKAVGHETIGTEHILLALIADERSVAVRILEELGATTDEVREAVARLVAHHGTSLS